MVFVINYFANEEEYDFKEVTLFLRLLKAFHFDRFIAETPIIEHSETNHQYRNPVESALASDRFQHTLLLKFRCEKTNDVFLFSQLFQAFCQTSGYTFELASYLIDD